MNTNVVIVIVITAVAAIVLENIVKLAWKKFLCLLFVKISNDRILSHRKDVKDESLFYDTCKNVSEILLDVEALKKDMKEVLFRIGTCGYGSVNDNLKCLIGRVDDLTETIDESDTKNVVLSLDVENFEKLLNKGFEISDDHDEMVKIKTPFNELELEDDLDE